MALVHHHEPHRSRDLALIGLTLVIFGLIAVAIPCSKVCVDTIFRFF